MVTFEASGLFFLKGENGLLLKDPSKLASLSEL